jgi:hypothetical protein
MHGCFDSLSRTLLSFSRNKTQLQKLFHEISRVAEKCLYEASKYGEVSNKWCTVAVVVVVVVVRCLFWSVLLRLLSCRDSHRVPKDSGCGTSAALILLGCAFQNIR